MFLFSIMIFTSCESATERRDRFFNRANQALERGNYQNAIQLYNQSLKADPEYVFALNNRGVAKSEQDHKYEAIIDFNQAIARKPDYLDALFNRAYAYEAIGQYKNALDDVREIKSMVKDSAFVFFYEGLVLTKMMKYDQAYHSFLVSDSLASDNPETLVNLATIHFFKREFNKAESMLEEVLLLESNNANAFNLFSLIELERGNYFGALAEINRALDEIPSEPYFLNNRGYIYLAMDSLEYAISDINRSIVLNPKNGWAYRNKGIYLLKKTEFERALALFSRAEKTTDFIDELYYFKGLALKELGREDEACDCWGKGVEKNEIRSMEMRNQNCN